MNCKDKGYEEGHIFEVTEGDNDGSLKSFRKGDIIVLSRDDGTREPMFDLVKGTCEYDMGIKSLYGAYLSLNKVKRIWPPERDTVSITCEGKTVEISRESAKALNLI